MSEDAPKIRNHWPVSILSSCASLFNVLLPIVLARVLDPDSFGVYKIFFLYLLLVPGVSMTTGLINGLSYWAGQGQEGRRSIQMTSWLILLQGLFLMVLVSVFAVPIATWLDLKVEHVMLLGVAVLGETAGRFFEEGAISVGRGWRGGIFYALFEVLRTATIVFAAWNYKTVTAVFIAQVTTVSVKTVIGYCSAYKLHLSRLIWNKKTFKAIYRYAFPVSVAGLLSILINYADQFILSQFLTKSDFAIYAVGSLAIAPLFMYEYSVARVMLPEISKAMALKNYPAAAAIHYATMEQLAIILVPAFFGISVFADSIIDLLFPAQYHAAVGYLRFSAIGYFLLIFPNDLIPRARGQGRWILWNFVFFSGLSLLLCSFFAWGWAAYGALIASLVVRALMRLYGLWYAGKSTGWKVREYCSLRPLAHNIIICIVLSVIVVYLKEFFTDIVLFGKTFPASVVWGIVCGPLFALFYFVSLVIWKLPMKHLDETKRVVMVCQNLWIGGLERVVLALAKNINGKNGFEVSVFAYDKLNGNEVGLVPEFEAAGIKLDLLQKREGFSCRTVFRLVRKILRERINVLHSHDLNAMIYATLAKLFCPRRVKVVHTQHSFVGFDKDRKHRLYSRIFSLFVDELVVVSEGTKKYYEKIGVPTKKIKIIENGIDFYPLPQDLNEKREIRAALLDTLKPDVAEKLRTVQDLLWIINVARISSEKGQHETLKLWWSLSEEVRQKTALIFVGPDNWTDFAADVKKQAQAGLSSEHVFFSGKTLVPQKWCQAADIFVSSSTFEGHPLGPLEAVAAGLPVVLSEIVGHEFLRSHASLYSLEDPQQGAECVESIVKSLEASYPKLLQSAAENAEWGATLYSVERMCKAYEDCYK
ncbi:MAG: glycosyltransferase [Bdellovibrionota bacterium]|jgi:O-antigen/teichoic acid export membrane protein/glycosyltransferase involved in cell wall biosynthesis